MYTYVREYLFYKVRRSGRAPRKFPFLNEYISRACLCVCVVWCRCARSPPYEIRDVVYGYGCTTYNAACARARAFICTRALAWLTVFMVSERASERARTASLSYTLVNRCVWPYAVVICVYVYKAGGYAHSHTHTMSAQICARAWNNCINNNNNKHVFLPASRQLIVRPQQYYSSVTVLCGLHMCGCVGGLHV